MKKFAQLADSWGIRLLSGANPINVVRKIVARQNLGNAVNRNWPDIVQKSCDILGNDAGKASHPSGAPWITLAAGWGHLECLEILLRSGADPRSVESDGTSALAVASEHGHFRCVEALLSAGADPNALNFAGESALSGLANKTVRSWAKGAGVDYARCAQILAASGADINHRYLGSTPLRMSVERGYSDIAIALLDAGACFAPDSPAPAASAAYYCARSNGKDDCARDLYPHHQASEDKAALSAHISEHAPDARRSCRL